MESRVNHPLFPRKPTAALARNASPSTPATASASPPAAAPAPMRPPVMPQSVATPNIQPHDEEAGVLEMLKMNIRSMTGDQLLKVDIWLYGFLDQSDRSQPIPIALKRGITNESLIKIDEPLRQMVRSRINVLQQPAEAELATLELTPDHTALKEPGPDGRVITKEAFIAKYANVPYVDFLYNSALGEKVKSVALSSMLDDISRLDDSILRALGSEKPDKLIQNWATTLNPRGNVDEAMKNRLLRDPAVRQQIIDTAKKASSEFEITFMETARVRSLIFEIEDPQKLQQIISMPADSTEEVSAGIRAILADPHQPNGRDLSLILTQSNIRRSIIANAQEKLQSIEEQIAQKAMLELVPSLDFRKLDQIARSNPANEFSPEIMQMLNPAGGADEAARTRALGRPENRKQIIAVANRSYNEFVDKITAEEQVIMVQEIDRLGDFDKLMQILEMPVNPRTAIPDQILDILNPIISGKRNGLRIRALTSQANREAILKAAQERLKPYLTQARDIMRQNVNMLTDVNKLRLIASMPQAQGQDLNPEAVALLTPKFTAEQADRARTILLKIPRIRAQIIEAAQTRSQELQKAL